jgi:predicted nucleic acid-binding protein
MRAYFDADVLIWHLRGKEIARNFFSDFYNKEEYELWIGAMQRAEIVFFMRDHEIESTMAFLSNFQCAPVDQKIIDLGSQLYRKWRPIQGIDINDAILASTAKITDGKIYTLNIKHYPMKEIIIQKPW